MNGTCRIPRLAIALCVALAGISGASAHVKMGKTAPTALEEPLQNAAPGTLYYVGYSHIDFNWLWDWPDTVHTWDSTARTALNLMYRFPDYKFAQTQAAAYLSMERIRPDLFHEIQNRVAQGRWNLIGGMWSESDTNLPSGEGLARVFLYGQLYFREKFNATSRVGFLPDTFGHTRQFPQILKQSGLDYFYFERCPRDKHLFWWQAPDGSRVLAYNSPGWYNERISENQAGWPNTILNEGGPNRAMVVYGIGNHGGGPTIADLKTLDTLRARPGFPEIRQTAPEQFYEDCLADRTDYRTYDEELQYTFEGCYTTHGDIKRLLRESENELYVAEALASLANLNGLDYPAEDLRFGWRHSAFNQFHDIAPGTAIHSTYEEAANKQKQFKQMTDKVIATSWSALEKKINTSGEGRPVAVFNPVAWARTDAVETTVAFDADPLHLRLTDALGNETPAQIVGREYRDGKAYITFVFVAENLPSLGYRIYHVSPSLTPPTVPNALTVADNVVTTPRFIVNVDAGTGQVSRLYDRLAQREVIRTGQRALRFALLGEKEDNNAWEIRLNGQTSYLDNPTSFQVLESGPVRARFRAVYQNGQSTYTQDILVYRNLDRIDAPMSVDFQDYNVLVKSVIPANVSSPTATFDVPFYGLQRPANGKVDVPMQKWMDVSQGTTYGLSVLNDGKYGADVNGGVMRQSLLRGTHSPDTVGDKGFHQFRLGLYPHTGNWKTAATMRRGYEFNLPPRVMPTTEHAGEWAAERSFLSGTLSNVVVTAFKKAEDGNGFILRYYDTDGETQHGSFAMPSHVASAERVNIIEDPAPGSLAWDGNNVFASSRPYAIHTVRVKM